MLSVIVVAGCRCRCRRDTAIILLFLMRGKKLGYGRRESNRGPERSQPKALTTTLPLSVSSWSRVVVFVVECRHILKLQMKKTFQNAFVCCYFKMGIAFWTTLVL